MHRSRYPRSIGSTPPPVADEAQTACPREIVLKQSLQITGRFLCVAAWLISAPGRADPVSLASLKGLSIDKTAISLSGISSGAFMAHQFHVIHSANIMGAGLIAGGPYSCAEGSYFWSWFDTTGLYAATSVCSNTNPYWFFQGPPDVDVSVEATRTRAANGDIDDPGQMRHDRVWLFSGANDDIVPTSVMDVVADYYAGYTDKQAIAYEKDDDANHAMITEDFGNACDAYRPHYINDCDFDAARNIFGQIYGDLNPQAAPEALQPVITFDQTAFFDIGDKRISMNRLGHIYVPRACAEGDTCRLHVAFHGCKQYQEIAGDLFYTRSAYNEWAETNRIVVLYPQTIAWADSLYFQYRQNPNGCWDWWGYSGEGYASKRGKQIRAVAEMINTLVDSKLLETPMH
jgi:poly(3-hydroxybutyrate) depolymerase